MNKKIIRLSLIAVSILLLTGCKLIKPNTENNNNKKTDTKVTISNNEIETMKKVTDVIFNVKKESLKTSDLTDEERGEVARSLITTSLEEVSGVEMTKEYEKYFGTGQKVKFADIPCPIMDHGSEDANIMMKFDADKDKYVYNENHPGHGGGGVEFIGRIMGMDSIEVNGDEYLYNVKILFYGKGICADVGGCNYGKGYKTYKDAENETNALLNIDESTQYWNMYDLPSLKTEELFNDYRDKLDVYTFKFVKENGNIIFKSYEKAS